jgi:hypothetical protein
MTGARKSGRTEARKSGRRRFEFRAAGCRPYGAVDEVSVGAAFCRPSLADVNFHTTN